VVLCGLHTLWTWEGLRKLKLMGLREVEVFLEKLGGVGCLLSMKKLSQLSSDD
jgi:hypothetical protein